MNTATIENDAAGYALAEALFQHHEVVAFMSLLSTKQTVIFYF